MKKALSLLVFVSFFAFCDQPVPLVIIGSGPAGLSAALYGARAKVKTLVITGSEPGGQLMGSGEVENWPGIQRKSGAEIMDGLFEQTESLGVEFLYDSIESVDFSQTPFMLKTLESGSIKAQAVIIATGSHPRKLHIPGESLYWGSGVSSCAVCDCFLYEGKKVAIVGGGDSAVEEALHLMPYAKKITIFVRKPHMRAAACMQDKLLLYPDKVEVVYTTEVQEVLGDGTVVTGLRVKNNRTQQESVFPVDGLFLAIGHLPCTELFKKHLDLASDQYICLTQRTQSTQIPGIFVAGDVADNRFRQAGVAAGTGIQAALEALEFLR